jgi:predicted Zn-dependent protease
MRTPALLVRAGLVVVAIAAVVWLGLGLRASRYEERGIALATNNKPTPAIVAEARRDLIDAEANNADSRPLLLQGELFIFAGQPARAIAPLLQVVGREPKNFEGWRLLTNAAAASHHAALAARANRQASILSPPVPRQ